MPIELKDIPEPIGNFILEQEDVKPLMMPDGAYYHYSHVCVMLKKILTSRFASAAPPTTEQTELWKELLNEAGKRLYAIDAEIISEETAIAQLAEKYSITRRQEVPEAVEFAEWLIKNSDDRTDNDRYAADGSVKSIPELYQQFQLFKQQKP